MRPDDPPDLPDNRPFPDYEGPRGFADALDGGYPVETDIEPHTTEEDPTPPATPLKGRALHNPIPPPSRFPDDDWCTPEPARARWKIATPIAVLIASAGLGIWLAIPTDNPPQAIPVTPTMTTTLNVPRTTPTARPTPAPRPTTTPARPTSTLVPITPRTRTPPPATRSTTTRPSKRPRPTVTITTAITITLRPRTPPPAHGPEEPPRTTTTEHPCLTWDDCHDDPPTS